MIEINRCPICNSTNLKPYLQAIDHTVTQQSFTIEACADCGFKITSPRPADHELGNYYQSDDYVSHTDSKKGLINYLYQKVKGITLKRKTDLIGRLSSERRLLDVGCGTGDFLSYAAAKGWEVSGLEPDEDARKRALSKLPGKIYPIEKFFSLEENNFDIITLWHVLEHVPDINAYMQQFFRLLHDNGKLILALPNPESADAAHYGSYWAAWDVPRHLYHFSKTNVVALSKKHGFKSVVTLPMVFDAYYVSMLSEKYKNGNIFKAAINGFISNQKARKNMNYSSLIHVFSKNAK